MKYKNRSLLRLSGKPPEEAPEQKSTQHEAAAVFRRFFYVLGRLDKAFRRGTGLPRDEEHRP